MDSIYTNPESLRFLYRNPKNPLRDLEEENSQAAQTLVATVPATAPGGGGGGGTGIPPGGCPAVGQLGIVRVPGTFDAKIAIPVQELKIGIDYLWHPIKNLFQRIVALEILKDVECVQYRTFAGAESIVTLTDMVIQSFEDERGRQICELLGDLENSHANVSVSRFLPQEDQIEWIKQAGKHDAVRITLEGERGGIYASGTLPDKQTVRHNTKPGPQGPGE
jgi:hypothetical protein